MLVRGLPHKAQAILPGTRPQSLPRLPLPNLPALQQPKAMSPNLSLTLTGGQTADFRVLGFLLAQKFYLL